MRTLLVVFLLSFGLGEKVFADLPPWAKSSASLHALDQFIEWMRDADFYRIRSKEVKEIKLDSGQAAVEMRLTFDDAKGCKERDHRSVCIPLDEKTIFCQDALSDCIPEGSKSIDRTITVE